MSKQTVPVTGVHSHTTFLLQINLGIYHSAYYELCKGLKLQYKISEID